MTHDPLCPNGDFRLSANATCVQCNLITRVREDEGNRYDGMALVHWDAGYAAGVHAASIVVAAWITPCNGLCCQSGNALLNRVLAAIDGLKEKS